ncbi:MAG: LamG domain-containing protein [Sedimentisphaerales bacterium]|nr:LamG domain-containing protein [Sedimentisphaerales bacterium]
MVTKNKVKWTMLWIYLINFVLVLVLAGNASAATKTWDAGGGANKLWSDGNNWNPNGVPTSADAAFIDNPPDANCLIDATVDACCASLDDSNSNKTCYLTMTGGTLTSTGNISVGHTGSPTLGDACGVFTMTGGTLKITGSNGRLWVGYGTGSGDPLAAEDSFGIFSMTTGCDVNIGGKIELGKNDTGVGQIYVDGGTLFVGYAEGGEDFEIGKYGTGTLYMTAGEVNVADAIKLAESGGTATIDINGGHIYCSDFRMPLGTPTVYLYGGDINCSDEFSMVSENALMDITEGTLIVQNGDYLNGPLGSLYEDVSLGKIVGYGGDGYVIITPESGGIGYSTVTAKPSDPNLAWKARPRNYATVDWTSAGPALSWSPGRYAADVNGHDVYFGTDRNDVNDANNTPGVWPEFKGRQGPNSLAFPVAPPPVLGQTYYWRIDEVNDACAPWLWKGIVWQFTMAGYEEVESFNEYADDDALKAVWTLTGESSEIHRETTIRRSGNSMKYVYYSDDTTEADANTTDANKLPVDINNWTTVDIKALTLYFYGDATNIAEKMYVALKDTADKTAVVYYDDPNDINEPEWHEWNIKLSDFNTPNDVNLHSIAKVYIGFGTRGSSTANGGTVYFDDIRLYPRRCVASRLPAGFGDINGDCDVNFIDVNMMKTDWLDKDYSGVGRDGNLMNFPDNNSQWVAGNSGNGLKLDGVDDWVDLDDSGFSNFHNKTIAFWIKVKEYSTPYRYMFYFTDTKEGVPNPDPYRIYFMTYTPGTYAVRVRFVDTYSADFTAGQDVWSYLAFVLKDAANNKCDGTFYCYNSATAVFSTSTTITGPRHSGVASGVNLGSENDGHGNDVNAVFDDFRVYDYALSAAEIWYLAHNGTGGGTPPNNTKMLLHYDFNEVGGLTAHNSSTYEFYHPLLSDAELYKGEAEGSRVVNSKDFAILANSWLEEQLWP